MVSLVKEEISERRGSVEEHINQMAEIAASIIMRTHPMGDSGERALAPDLRERVEIVDRAFPSIEDSLRRYPNKVIIDPLEEGQLQSAGLDFTVGNLVYSSDVFRRINFLDDLRGMRRLELKEGEQYILEPDDSGRRIYYILSKEQIKIPNDLELVFDAKSTTGRLGCMCHHVANPDLIRQMPNPLIAAVVPHAFPIKITAGKSRLFQGIIRYKQSPFMSHEEIRAAADREQLSLLEKGKKLDLEKFICADGLRLTFSTQLVYRARSLAEILEAIDIEKRDFYNPEDYFERIESNGEILMEPKRLYLFGTEQEIRLGSICGRLSREHHDTMAGLWTHFAGFFWPFYCGEITLEGWSDKKRIITRGELAGVVALDALSGACESINGYQGSYQGQKAPKLPKVFKEAA